MTMIQKKIRRLVPAKTDLEVSIAAAAERGLILDYIGFLPGLCLFPANCFAAMAVRIDQAVARGPIFSGTVEPNFLSQNSGVETPATGVLRRSIGKTEQARHSIGSRHDPRREKAVSICFVNPTCQHPSQLNIEAPKIRLFWLWSSK